MDLRQYVAIQTESSGIQTQREVLRLQQVGHHGRDQQVKAAFRAAYEYLDRHSSPQQTDEYWMQAADEMTQIYNRYGADPLLGALLVAAYAEMERRAQADRQHDAISEAI